MNNHKQPEQWDIIIQPNDKLINLKLRKLWSYRDLLWLMIRRDFVSFYKQTVFGPIWFFVQPIFTTITFIFVFGQLARIGTENIPQPLFYLSGIIVWSYFSECLLKTSTVLRDNAGIFGKVYFPRLIVPISIVFSSMVKLLVQLLLFFIILLFYYFNGYDKTPGMYIFIFPFMIFFVAITSLGLGLMVSALTTKYRDLSLLLNYAIQLLMYSAPVAYPLSNLKGLAKIIVSLNPMTFIIEGVRMSFFGIGTFSFSIFLFLLIMSFLTLFIGIIIFNRAEKNFIDTI